MSFTFQSKRKNEKEERNTVGDGMDLEVCVFKILLIIVSVLALSE